mmetsp:Transcript_19836/g.17531  ORF Transcript_19836/g.17531 Transcript_19836/m.17531 type:complete len:90 (+) Transcript_19836:275-544(+)
MSKEYEKGIKDIKYNRKEKDYTIDYSKSPINFDYEILPKINSNIKPISTSNSKESLMKIMEKGYKLSFPNHLNTLKMSLREQPENMLTE